MTQVSKYPVTKEVEARMYEVLFDSISMVRSPIDVNCFIEDLFSKTEKIMFSKRLAIALLLLKHYDQRMIAKLLRVSLGTVSKVSIVLQRGKGGYSKVTSAIVRKEKFHEFIQKLDDAMANLFPPAHTDWSHWRKERWEAKLQAQKPF